MFLYKKKTPGKFSSFLFAQLRKKFARRLKYSREASPQDFEGLLPGGCQPNAAAAADVPAVVDAETTGIEAANEDVVAIRVETGCTHIDIRE